MTAVQEDATGSAERRAELIRRYNEETTSAERQALERDIGLELSASGTNLDLAWRWAMLAGQRGNFDESYSRWKSVLAAHESTWFLNGLIDAGLQAGRPAELTILASRIARVAESTEDVPAWFHQTLLRLCLKLLDIGALLHGSHDAAQIFRACLLLEDRNPGRQLRETMVHSVAKMRLGDDEMKGMYAAWKAVLDRTLFTYYPPSGNEPSSAVLYLYTAESGMRPDAEAILSALAAKVPLFSIEQLLCLPQYRAYLSAESSGATDSFPLYLGRGFARASHNGPNDFDCRADRLSALARGGVAEASTSDRKLAELLTEPEPDSRVPSVFARARRAISGAASGSKRRRRSLAVCVSGQLRGFEAAFESWKATILKDIDYDIYVASWRSRGTRELSPPVADRVFPAKFAAAYARAAREIGVSEVHRLYPTLFKAVEETRQVSEDEVAQVYDARTAVLEDEAEPRFAGWPNAQKMYYKIEQAHRLARESDCSYDYIMRIRPDKAVIDGTLSRTFETGIPHDVVYSDAGYFFGPWIGFGVGDQMAVGRPEAMDAYASVSALAYLSRENLTGYEHRLTGHRPLAFTLFFNGISVKTVPIKWGQLLVSNELTAHVLKRLVSQDATARDHPLDAVMLRACEDD